MTTPTPSDFVELLTERGMPSERANHVVEILFSAEMPRLARFAMLSGVMGFPPKEAAALAKELDETRLADEVNTLAKRVADAEARARSAEAVAENRELIGQLLEAHLLVFRCEAALVERASGAADFAKTVDGKKAWARLGDARNKLDALTRAWIKAGHPGAKAG